MGRWCFSCVSVSIDDLPTYCKFWGVEVLIKWHERQSVFAVASGHKMLTRSIELTLRGGSSDAYCIS